MRYFLFISLFFFYGCFKDPLPKWYINQIYQDTQTYLYGSGEGDNKKDAVNSALSFIASKIRVKISSEISSQKSVLQISENVSVYKNISENIKASVENFSFYDYEVVKIKKMDEKYYVLVRVNRKKNAKLLFYDIKNQFEKIKANLSIINSFIEKVDTYKRAVKQIDKLVLRLYVVKLLDKEMSKNVESLFYQMLSYKKRLQEELKNISFLVKSKDEKLKNIIETILTDKGFNISYNGVIIIDVKNKISYTKVIDNILATNKVQITIFDNKITKKYNLMCVGKSFDKKTALNLSYIDCKEKLKEKIK